MGSAYLKPGHLQTMVELNSATNNIPTAYSSATGSLLRNVQAPVGVLQQCNAFAVINLTSGNLYISTDGVNDHAFCPAGSGTTPGITLIEHVAVGPTLYIKSATGSALSSGLVLLMVW